MKKRPESELLFEKYCQQRGYVCEKIPECENRTADYNVEAAQGCFVCEVTQLEPNEVDKAWRKKVVDNNGFWPDEPPRECSEIAKRVRGRLKDKVERAQLKQYRSVPTLLVLCDVTGRFYLDDFQLDGAMYGDQEGWISADPNDPGEYCHGGNRLFRPDRGEYISAVAILHSFGDGVSLEIYHNYFAENPFSFRLLEDFKDKHFVKTTDPQKRWTHFQQVQRRAEL